MEYKHRFVFELENRNHLDWNFFDSRAICSIKIPEFKTRENLKWGPLVATYYDLGNEDFHKWIKQITELPDNLSGSFHHGYVGTLAYLDEKGNCTDSSKFELILESIDFSPLDYSSNDPRTISLKFKVVNFIYRV